MNLKDNKIIKNKWFQIVAYIFLVILIGNINEKAAGWFVIISSIGLTTYQFFLNKKFKENKIILKIGTGFLLFIMFLTGIGMCNPVTPEQKTEQQKTAIEQQNPDSEKIDEQTKSDEKKTVVDNALKSKPVDVALTNNSVSGQLKIHFIDVGQADSILIQQGNDSMLIDAGNNEDSDTVKNYISNQGITKLNYIIGTHPHEDHIGGLDYIINSFQVGQIYMPKAVSNTKTFKDVVNAITSKGMAAKVPTVGESFKIGDATATILAPNSSSYEDLNNTSIVIRLTFGNNSFMFDGDAEDVSENEMLSKGLNVSADLIKIGHHGSSSSSTENFLNKVNPKYAVISVGKGNSYGHPHQTTMNKLQSKGIKVYRTDENGTIIATSDGKNITFNTNPASYAYAGTGTTNNSNVSSNSSSAPTPAPVQSINSSDNSKTVYYTPSGKSYHYSKDCRTLKRSKTILDGTLGETLQSSHSDPCNVCVH